MLGTNCGLIQSRYTYTNNAVSASIQTKRYVPIYVDKTFSAGDRLSIDNAINQWNYALNKQIILKAVSYDFDMEPDLIRKAQLERGWLFLKVDSGNSTIPDNTPYEQCKMTKGCAWTLAWTDREGGWIVKIIRDRMSADNVEEVALHEIGHLLGATHSKNENSLMYARYSKERYLCIDAETVYQVAKIYAIDVKSINYCLNRY